MATRFQSEQLRDLIRTSQGKSYTVIVATSMLVLGLFLFAVFPAGSAIVTQLRETGERKAALAQIDTKRITLRNLLQQESQDRAFSVAIASSLPDGVGQTELLADLLDMAQQSQVVIRNMRFGDASAARVDTFAADLDGEGDIAVLDLRTVTITTEGSRDQLEEFVVKMEQLRRIMNIQSFNLARSATNPSQFILSTQAEIYFWNLDTEENEDG